MVNTNNTTTKTVGAAVLVIVMTGAVGSVRIAVMVIGAVLVIVMTGAVVISVVTTAEGLVSIVMTGAVVISVVTTDVVVVVVSNATAVGLVSLAAPRTRNTRTILQRMSTSLLTAKNR